MLGRLVGILSAITPPQVLVDVAGVGYEVDIPISDFVNLPDINNKITLFVHLVIREDAHTLFGFLNISSRNCFRVLLKVSGIGPRTALALLSTFSPNELYLAVDSGDVTTLCRAPGIGKKVAERMILELKGKLSSTQAENSSLLASKSELITNDSNSATDLAQNSVRLDIANALASLGYDNKQINLAMRQMPSTGLELSTGIKEALRILTHTHRL